MISAVAEFIAERTRAPRTIPIRPAIKVKKTDSRIIWVLTSEGVAPSARLIPNSFVLSFTEISKIFPIPTTPAIIVASPTTSERKVIPLENPTILPKISPRFIKPKASSSSGETLWARFKVASICFSILTGSSLSYAARKKKLT